MLAYKTVDLKKIASKADIIFQKYSTIDSNLKTYPKGQCRLASDLFGVSLLKAGYNNIQIAYQGTNSKGVSHAWLEYDGIVIDLTCYQFSEQWSEVYVGKITKWHINFKGQQKRLVDETEIIAHWGSIITILDYILDDIYKLFHSQH